ncbi:MAG: creatininase family protein [Bacillota bacterium]
MLTHLSTWDKLAGVKLAFLPVGSLEQHGLHLPLGTDGIIASALAKELASRFQPSYLLPPLHFSFSYEHSSFPGSVSLKVGTMAAVISDIIDSLAKDGMRCIIVNCHMGNHLLRNIVQELNLPAPRVLLVPDRHHWENAYKTAGLSSTTSADMHAGEGETSLLLHLAPETVLKDKIQDVDQPARPLLEAVGIKQYTPTGAIGFPSRASSEKGKALLNALVNEIRVLIEEFRKIV